MNFNTFIDREIHEHAWKLLLMTWVGFTLILYMSSMADAQGIQRITITDLTSDFNDRITIYQNDTSQRYVQNWNMTETEPLTISANHTFILYMTPKERTILRELEGPKFFDTIIRNGWVIVLLFMVVALIGLAFYTRRK